LEGDVTEPPTGCGLYVVIEAGDGAAARLSAALAAIEPAAVLIAPVAGERLDVQAAKPLLEQARQVGITGLILDDVELARALGADGVHLVPQDDAPGAYRAAREALGKDGVVGVDAGISRHAAMLMAESGADYVGFGAPAHLKDRDKARTRRDELIAWWAPIFEVPSVAFDVETPEEAARLDAAGADFVAIALRAQSSTDGVRELLSAVAQAINASKTLS
jgi:thiamine-phosphate pyrophosphorylase